MYNIYTYSLIVFPLISRFPFFEVSWSQPPNKWGIPSRHGLMTGWFLGVPHDWRNLSGWSKVTWLCFTAGAPDESLWMAGTSGCSPNMKFLKSASGNTFGSFGIAYLIYLGFHGSWPLVQQNTWLNHNYAPGMRVDQSGRHPKSHQNGTYKIF